MNVEIFDLYCMISYVFYMLYAIYMSVIRIKSILRLFSRPNISLYRNLYKSVQRLVHESVTDRQYYLKVYYINKDMYVSV